MNMWEHFIFPLINTAVIAGLISAVVSSCVSRKTLRDTLKKKLHGEELEKIRNWLKEAFYNIEETKYIFELRAEMFRFKTDVKALNSLKTHASKYLNPLFYS